LKNLSRSGFYLLETGNIEEDITLSFGEQKGSVIR